MTAPSAGLRHADLSRERNYLRDLGRAFAGALIFNIPLLMTMEMWEQGVVQTVIVLGFPASIGAAAARLLV